MRLQYGRSLNYFHCRLIMSNYILRLMLIMVFITGYFTNAFSQSCCSGGVPISNNLGLPALDAKTIQFALSYDLNILKTLKDGSSKLNDEARRRITHSILFQTGYVFSKRWSAEFFMSWIRQERRINQFGNISATSAKGLGDAVLLMKYKLIINKANGINWYIGAGPKFATGKSDRRDKNDIALNADLQPGSGSLDLVTWSQVTKNSKVRPTLTYSATASFSLKGKNKNYLGSQVYQFGNELIAIAGIADQFAAKKFLWGASLQTMYRYAFQDRNDGENTPGTGGRWIFIRPGVTLKPGKTFAINGNVNLPAYSWVRDTQLTPTVRYNVSFYYEIPWKKSFFNKSIK